MSFAPPAVPPLPQDFNQHPRRQNSGSKPPIPPLPPNFRPEHPLAAPTPERVLPTLPADMARSLDESLNYNPTPSRTSSLHPTSPYQDHSYRRASPAPPHPSAGYPGGFARPPSASPYGGPPRMGPSPAPYAHGSPGGFAGPPPGANGAGYMSPPPPGSHYSLPGALSSLTISSYPPPPPRSASAQPHPHPPQSPASMYPSLNANAAQSIPMGSQSRPPELTAPLPTLDSLTSAQRALPLQPGPEHVPWVRDVLFLVDRIVAQQSPGGQAPEGAVSIPDPTLLRLAHTAIVALLSFLNSAPQAPPLPPHVIEAIYIRGTLLSSGAFPDQIAQNPRDAFRDFESAARAGYQKAWFKLGRDYEVVGDISRAKDCFERGVRGGVESCFYRMGMARLLGQLSLPASPQDALILLHRAATLASTEVPQPAYVYGLLLLGEFSHVRLEEHLFSPLIPQGSSPLLEARKFVERAAYLGFAPAQYKLGHSYEYAVSPFPFDPLLSVQYYSLASQQGEPEADMALSKWFLCGADGAFEKDESLAWTFADKAARQGLASAEFAMGYYAEVGVGGRKDMEAARRWYAKAVEHGNADAPDRLQALSQPSPQALSRTEHDQITDAKLVRKHTQARLSATAAGRHAQPPTQGQGQGVVGRIQAQAQSSTAPPQPAHQAPPQQSHSASPQQQQQQHQGQIRYSLTDAPPPPGSVPPSSLPPGAAPPAGRAAGRPPGRRHEKQGEHSHSHSGSPAPAPGPGPAHPGSPALPLPSTTPPRKMSGPGPATFAEMGFQSGKAEEKDCRIM